PLHLLEGGTSKRVPGKTRPDRRRAWRGVVPLNPCLDADPMQQLYRLQVRAKIPPAVAGKAAGWDLWVKPQFRAGHEAGRNPRGKRPRMPTPGGNPGKI